MMWKIPKLRIVDHMMIDLPHVHVYGRLSVSKSYQWLHRRHSQAVMLDVIEYIHVAPSAIYSDYMQSILLWASATVELLKTNLT